jgi:CRP/FNR family transcriptional regulator, anaerobic regulatory protein
MNSTCPTSYAGRRGRLPLGPAATVPDVSVEIGAATCRAALSCGDARLGWSCLPLTPAESSFPFVSALDETARREFRAFKATRARKGQLLLERGDRNAGAVLVVAGLLRVYYVSSKGAEATLYNVEPGGTCILALASAFNDEPYPAWVQAGPEGASFIRIPNASFRQLFDRHGAFREFVFTVLSGRILELMRTLEERGSRSIEQRLARYLVRRARDGTARITQTAIAAELGTAREVVFRALRSLAAQGLIETGRRQVSIVDRRGLLRLAEG